MSAAARVPVCVTLPPSLIERADRLAEADERSRSFIVTRALERYCEDFELRPPGLTPPVMPEAARSAEGSSGLGGTPLSYPASLHVDAVRRVRSVATERAETDRQNCERVAHQNADYMNDLGTTTP